MYQDDLEFCVQLVNALTLIVDQCQKREVKYHDLAQEIKGLVEGVNVRLPDGTLIQDADGNPLHGLLSQIEKLNEVADLLELEVELNTTERQALEDTED